MNSLEKRCYSNFRVSAIEMNLSHVLPVHLQVSPSSTWFHTCMRVHILSELDDENSERVSAASGFSQCPFKSK